MTEPLLIERDGGVTTLTMNRPESLNSLDRALKEALRDALAEVAADRSCRAVVLAGAGRAFCVGQDLREHVTTLETAGANPLETVAEHYNPIARQLANLPQPVVAAVRGMAAGAGAGLALLADFRIGGPRTTFLMAFANVGLAGDTAVSYTLPRLIGLAQATELLMLAQPVPAGRARELGLLTALVDEDDQVPDAARALAGRLSQGPTAAYAAIKRELAVGATGTLEQALTAEYEAQRATGATADHRAATLAFVAKRTAEFTGR